MSDLNPFVVGDMVVCIEDGWCELRKGRTYAVLRADKRHVWTGDNDIGACWERFVLESSVALTIAMKSGAAEYEDAMAAEEIYSQLLEDKPCS